MTKQKQLEFLRKGVAGAATVVAIASAVYMWNLNLDPNPKNLLWPKVILTVWALGPPIWFGLEYILFVRCDTPQKLPNFKMGQELSGKFWAGIAALLAALYKLNGG